MPGAVTEEPRSYTCSTQKKLHVELLPDELTNNGSRPPDGIGGELVLGVGTQVPRWDVVARGPCQLKYFVQVGEFPRGTAQKVSQAFQAAADEWSAMGLGVSFVEASDASDAHFDLKYWNVDDGSGILAKAFWPNEKNHDVWVYAYALEPNNFQILQNIFAHEIGHILGLRHEFAITGDSEHSAEELHAVQFNEKNPKSIMSYTFPPEIQTSDRKDTQSFYKLPNGTKIGGLPVKDYIPTIKERKR